MTEPSLLWRREGVVAAVVCVGAALWFVLVELHRPGMPAFDIYVYFIPNKLHAAMSLADGGKGLLWNPYQSCGEPFFANPTMGLLYPPHLAFALLDVHSATHVVLIFNMAVGALGMFLLARRMGLHWAAALGAALAYELGDPMAQLTGWSPTHNGPWAWLPWALLGCERLLRSPARLGVAALALILALALLPGWVLIVALTYQLLALRVAWELLTVRPRPWRGALAIAAAMLLAPLLTAVQLLPAAELARESFRLAVESLEFAKLDAFIVTLRQGLLLRTPPLPFTLALLALAAAAPFVATSRRLLTFYLLTALLYAVLALGTTTPLYALYAAIPPGVSTLKYPWRLWWMVSFCLAMLAAFCLDGLGKRSDRWTGRWLGAIVAMGAVGGLGALVPGGLRPSELLALALAIAAVIAATLRPRLATAAMWVALLALAANLLAVPLRHRGNLLPSIDGLWASQAAFAAIDPPLTAQDRVYLLPGHSTLADLSFIRKTATVLRVPDLHDYDALLGRRFSEYAAAMWPGAAPVTTTDDFVRAVAPAPMRRRLLDLAAIRYVVASPPTDVAATGLDLPRVPPSGARLQFYRNDAALPRARFVPRIEVVPDPHALLERLAGGGDDPAAVALVEAPLPSGYSGSDAPAAAASTRIVVDDPEHIVIEVDAPAAGFVVLADQFYPGWRASVNGADVDVHRANYMFRLVEVPAGRSRVEFVYRPMTVAAGAAISTAALGLLAVVAWQGWRRTWTP